MKTAADAWKQNLTKKVEELRALIVHYLTRKEDTVGDEIAGRLAGLKMMFAENQIPQPLHRFESALSQFRPHKNHQDYFLQMMRCYDDLSKVAAFSEEDNPSFDQIFESYKADGELEALVNELVELLQRILTEADDVLSAHVARELEVILEQLKNRKKRSLYELQSWVELGVRALLLVVETKTGVAGLELVYEAGKVACRIRRRMMEMYVEAQKRLVQTHKLTLVEKALVLKPDAPSEEQFQKLLDSPRADS